MVMQMEMGSSSFEQENKIEFMGYNDHHEEDDSVSSDVSSVVSSDAPNPTSIFFFCFFPNVRISNDILLQTAAVNFAAEVHRPPKPLGWRRCSRRFGGKPLPQRHGCHYPKVAKLLAYCQKIYCNETNRSSKVAMVVS